MAATGECYSGSPAAILSTGSPAHRGCAASRLGRGRWRLQALASSSPTHANLTCEIVAGVSH
eukprot:7005358-Pyramimonas_sp.AAC.1